MCYWNEHIQTLLITLNHCHVLPLARDLCQSSPGRCTFQAFLSLL
jgi:hypothetical protein